MQSSALCIELFCHFNVKFRSFLADLSAVFKPWVLACGVIVHCHGMVLGLRRHFSVLAWVMNETGLGSCSAKTGVLELLKCGLVIHI